MSKSPRKTISLAEPAERPITIALSVAELCALRDHHARMIKRVTNAAWKSIASTLSHSEHKAIIKVAQEHIGAHSQRAKGLQAIIREHI